jgi:recombination protein RecT
MRADQTRGTNGRGNSTDAARQDSPADARIKAIFKTQYRQLSALFPDNGEVMVNRACAAAVNASRTSALKDASAESIAAATIACHHLGLEPGDQAYLVPFKGEVQLIIGPRGLISLMFRSGFVKSVRAHCVFEADATSGVWDYDLGSSKYIRHRKAPVGRRSGFITHAYAIVDTTTEGQAIEVLTQEDLEYYRGFSQAKSGPWFDNYEGMCRKTVLKRIAEFVPRSPMLSAALREDSHGGYEIPEEILQAARGKADGSADMPQTAPTGEVVERVIHANGTAS